METAYKKILLFILLMFAAIFCWWGQGVTLPVPDTGQTQSYTSTLGEDSDYTVNPLSYTKLGQNGVELQDDATSWIMVRDNVSGLIWEVKQNWDGVKDYSNPNDADNTYTWYDSNPATNAGNAGTYGDGTDTEDFIYALNSANFGGFSDWRLPTRKELRNIVNFGRYNPSIDTAYFPNTKADNYWSSTTNGHSNGYAWLMYFLSGQDNHDNKSSSHYVQAVRGGL